MKKLQNIEPGEFFGFFEEISSIPRGSGNSDKISDYLERFAKERDLYCIRDDHNNILIKKDAQGGGTSKDAVIIQGHTDMVTVAGPGKDKDFLNEGIELCIEGDHVYADRTSLGADDGVAVCYALAVLDSNDIKHPPIEALFTADEEIGLIGAGYFDASLLTGRTFLNIDSEDDGIFFAGCAGGATCEINRDISADKGAGLIIEMGISGLSGGHSGMEIDKRRANSNKVMGIVLQKFIQKYDDMTIVSITGGEKENAIAPFTNVKIFADKNTDLQDAESFFCRIMEDTLKPYKKTDPNVKYYFEIKDGIEKSEFIPRKDSVMITDLLSALDDGVITMSEQLSDVVETSENIGIVNISPSKCSIILSVRSLITEKRNEQVEKIKRFTAGNFKVNVSGVYSPWSYTPESPVRDILMEEYKKVTGKEPKQMVIHAGLECGVFAEKIPGTDFVSFGPQADDIHTYNERLSISSVQDYWTILKNTLEKLADQKNS